MWIVAGLLVVIATVLWSFAPYARSAAFVLDLTGSKTWFRPLLLVRPQPVTATDLVVPTRRGAIDARLYQVASPARTIVVFPGIHRGGVDEPRLDAFARRLSAAGSTVLSVPLPGLRTYHIAPESTDAIEDTVGWMAAQPEYSPSGRVAIVGVSFSGGLALVAAARPSLQNKVQAILSLGGHADLPRVMRFLCTGILPDGSRRAPHDYGVVIILRGGIEKLVPPNQVASLQHAVDTFLDGSGYESTDPQKSRALLEQARVEGDALAEPSRSLMALVIARDVKALGERLLPYVEALGGAPSLSPDRSPAPNVPVFLLHGTDDNIIPAAETPLTADYLRSRGNTKVEWLQTPLLSHANVQSARYFSDAWRLIAFWKRMLSI